MQGKGVDNNLSFGFSGFLQTPELASFISLVVVMMMMF